MQTWTRALLTVFTVVTFTQSPVVQGQGRRGEGQKPVPPPTGTTPATTPAATPANTPSTWIFAAGSGMAGMVFFQVKPASAPAFESAVGRIKAALLASKDPIRQRQAQNWQVFKLTEPVAADDPIIYVFFLPTVVADADYDPLKILTAQFPAEAQTIYESLSKGSTAINRMGLKKIADMGPGS